MSQDRADRAEEPQLRVGDAERQLTSDRLITAHGLGQLDTDEMTERLAAVHTAKFRNDLNAQIADLPAPPPSTGESSGLERIRGAIGGLSAISNVRSIVLIVLAALSGAGVALMLVGGDQEHDGFQPGMHAAEHGDGHEFDGGPSAWLLLIPILTATIATAAWFVHHRRQQRS